MPFNLQSVPTKFLVAKVLTGTSLPIDTVNDETSQFNGYPFKFQVEIFIDIQTHSGENTREPFVYNAYDAIVGDWFAQPTGKTYEIVQVIGVIDQQNIILILEDKNLYNLKSDPSQQGNNYPDEDQPGAIFQLDEDGNPILAGITNQSAQFPGLTYWIEDIKSRFEYYSVDEEGVETDIDFDQNIDAEIFAEGTNGNGSSTGITIEYTPFADSNVEVKINGVGVNLGSGVLTKDCYFSNDGGITPKLMKNIEAGDILYWNGANAGYELDPLDDIDFEYEASNLDL
jgi:hypothetical protein